MTPGGIRVTAVSALASFLVILVAGFLASIGHAPSTGSSGTEIVSFVRDNRGALLAAIFLYSVAFALFLCFAAGLSAFLWQAERGLGGLPSAIGLGAAALVALELAGFATFAALIYRPPDPALARVLYDLAFMLLALSGVPTAVCLGAYGWLVLRRGRLPAWTAWLAIAGAAANAIIAASFLTTSGPFSLEGEVPVVWVPLLRFVWMLAVSICLLETQPAPE